MAIVYNGVSLTPDLVIDKGSKYTSESLVSDTKGRLWFFKNNYSGFINIVVVGTLYIMTPTAGDLTVKYYLDDHYYQCIHTDIFKNVSENRHAPINYSASFNEFVQVDGGKNPYGASGLYVSLTLDNATFNKCYGSGGTSIHPNQITAVLMIKY